MAEACFEGKLGSSAFPTSFRILSLLTHSLSLSCRRVIADFVCPTYVSCQRFRLRHLRFLLFTPPLLLSPTPRSLFFPGRLSAVTILLFSLYLPSNSTFFILLFPSLFLHSFFLFLFFSLFNSHSSFFLTHLKRIFKVHILKAFRKRSEVRSLNSSSFETLSLIYLFFCLLLSFGISCLIFLSVALDFFSSTYSSTKSGSPHKRFEVRFLNAHLRPSIFF